MIKNYQLHIFLVFKKLAEFIKYLMMYKCKLSFVKVESLWIFMMINSYLFYKSDYKYFHKIIKVFNHKIYKPFSSL